MPPFIYVPSEILCFEAFKTFTNEQSLHASSEFLFSRNGNVCRYSSFHGKKSVVVFLDFLFETLSVVLNPRQSPRPRSQLFYHSHLLEQVYFPVHLNKLFPHIRLSQQKHVDTFCATAQFQSMHHVNTVMEVPRSRTTVKIGNKLIITIGVFLQVYVIIFLYYHILLIIKNQQLKK